MLMIFVCSAVLFQLSSAQPQHHCCTPDQWEGYYTSLDGYKGEDPADARLQGSRIHYDQKGNRTAVSGYRYYENSGHRENYTVIDNFVTKKRLSVVGNACTIETLSHSMRPPCIPDDYFHHGGEYIGTGEGNLSVNVFSAPIPRPDEFHIRTVTDHMCIPFQMRHVIVHESFGLASFASFNRITPGIADDKVFDIPPQCQPYSGQFKKPQSAIAVLDMFHELEY